MLLSAYFLAFLLALCAYLYRRMKKVRQVNGKTPPGLPNLPLIGSLLHMAKYKGKNKQFLQDMTSRFGSTFSVHFGSQYIVFTEDYAIIREVLNAEEWIDRAPQDHPMWYERSFNKPIGLLTGSGSEWKETRKFTIKSLREFGFGREGMEARIELELGEFLRRRFQIDSSGHLYINRLFQIPVLNILWNMLAGYRFDYDDPKLGEILRLSAKMNEALKLGLSTRFAYPWMRHLPGLTDQKILLSTHAEIQALILEIMQEKRKDSTLMEKIPEDVIDVYLQEIETRIKSKTTRDTDKYFTDDRLIMVGTDLFITGSDSTSAALEFGLLYMVVFPQVQKKVQEEIDAVIGSGQIPPLDLKPKMPYLEATTLEILRFSSSFPMALRTSQNDTELGGHLIPKGTLVGLNLEGMHHSKMIWSDPDVFRPERFLDDAKVINSEKIFPFGTGKRICLGETLARATLFKFFTTLLQRFSFEAYPHHPPPSLEPISGFGQFAKPFHVKVTRRG